jgi:adenosylcobyric acid synthase
MNATVRKARSLMVMGTASDVGKSVIVTGLCRLFARSGVRVAPFKAQNMSNNAAVCADGGEIGRAQAVQAEACGLEPQVDMNPVLLKPDSECGCQVVIAGRSRFRMTTREHAHYREHAWPEITGGYNRLAARFDLIIIEGAGGAAEVNLRERDLVNWRVAEFADAPVLLAADIDKGGALAAIVGTVELLSPAERRRVKGLVMNKFRGDRALLEDGLRIVEERIGIPFLGVLPYANGLDVPQEDSASLKAAGGFGKGRPLRVGVVRLPRISNYTDFESIEREPDVDLQYFEMPERAGDLDILCIPGSKSTIADLQWLRECGWDHYIRQHRQAGGSILGICAGYQMLGRAIHDPEHVESSLSQAQALGMLDVETVFAAEKITARVRAVHAASGLPVCGYEIHCGRIIGVNSRAPFTIRERQGRPVNEPEGAASDDGLVLGTSIHGLFDDSQFRRHYLNQVRLRKRLPALDASSVEDAAALRMKSYDRLADLIAANLDVSALAGLVGLEGLELHRSSV